MNEKIQNVETKGNIADSLTEEFQTVEILLKSPFKTGRTDAFIVAWVKREKQVRRIFTYLIYQFPSFSKKNVTDITNIIASKQNLYLKNFIKGFNALYPKTFKEIIGSEFDRLEAELNEIRKYRNKILHGQLTGQSLNSDQLTNKIHTIQEWCSLVAMKMSKEIGFDGFARNSFRKYKQKQLADSYKHQIADLKALNCFIETYM